MRTTFTGITKLLPSTPSQHCVQHVKTKCRLNPFHRACLYLGPQCFLKLLLLFCLASPVILHPMSTPLSGLFSNCTIQNESVLTFKSKTGLAELVSKGRSMKKNHVPCCGTFARNFILGSLICCLDFLTYCCCLFFYYYYFALPHLFFILVALYQSTSKQTMISW